MATGEVIACHTKDEFESQMAQAKENHKLVRARGSPGSPYFFGGVFFFRGFVVVGSLASS